MEKYYNANRSSVALSERPSFAWPVLDGVPIDEKECQLPRRDFGPIGGEIKGATRSIGFGSGPLMFSWTSDFMNKDGTINELARGSGLVACLPKIPVEATQAYSRAFPPRWKPFQKNGPGLIPQKGPGLIPQRGSGVIPQKGSGVIPQKGSGVIPQKGPGVIPQNGPGGIPRHDPGRNCEKFVRNKKSHEWSHVSTSSSNSMQSDSGSTTSGYETASITSSPEAGRVASTNEADAKEFAARYGLDGPLHPAYLHRPKKGKYFKKFNE